MSRLINEIIEHLPFLRKQDLERSAFLRFVFTHIFSTDHKTIGKQYLMVAIFWAFAGGLISIIMRLQLGFPEADFNWLKLFFGDWIIYGKMDPEFYLKMVTIHGTIMVFFLLTSGFIGSMGNFIIPLQIGARDMASGFINMLSFWLFFLSGIILFWSLFIETGAASAGWTMYPPLSALPSASIGSKDGVTLWIISIAIFIISNLLNAINIISTVVNLRTEGMTFRRLPLSVWAILFAVVLGLLTFPVLLAAVILLFFDKTLHTSFYLANIYIGEVLAFEGGSPLLYQHLFWFLGHPEVYIAIFPAFGIVSDVISTNARKPIFGYSGMVASMFAIMLLSFIVWAHHMFISGMDPFLGPIFSATSFVIAVPSSVKVFNWLSTLWKGNIHFPPAMLFALGMVSYFISGGLTGLYVANPVIDMYVHDTYFVVAHFHLVMGSATVFGFFAGIYHWYPKMFNRTLNKSLSYLHFWITFIGVYCIFFPMHYMGISGLPRRYYLFSYFESFSGYADLNAFITIAAIVTFAAQFILLFNFFYSMLMGNKAPENPWNSNTLDWASGAKNIAGNWEGELPKVYRYPYEYSVKDAKQDYFPQHLTDIELKEKGILEKDEQK